MTAPATTAMPLGPAFSGEADVRVLAHRPGWPTRVKVQAPLTYGALLLPAGWVSDGASIPRAAWYLIGHPFDARWLRSALFHDLFCSFRVGRWQDAVAQFDEMMRAEGNTGWRRPAMTRAVWAFGPHWRPWEAITLDDLAEITSTRAFTWQLEDRRP